MYIRRQITRLCLSCRETSYFAVTYVRLVAGYMLLYDDQGVSLVYGTLSRVAGVSIDGTLWNHIICPVFYWMMNKKMNKKMTDQNDKNMESLHLQKNLVPESINIQKLSTSTGSYDPLKRRRAACALWQHRGFCSLWGRCLQGRAQERGHIEQLKPRVRHEACIFLQLLVKCAGSFCWAWLFPSGAGGPPRNRYQHLWCTQCGNHQGVTPGCQINVSFDHRVSKNSGVSERVGIDCSCFSLGDHHFSTRTCAEKMLWLRAISNVKATQSKPLRFCQDSPIWYRL